MGNPVQNFDYALLKILNVDLGSVYADRFWLVMTHLERHWPTWVVAAGLLAWGFYIYGVNFLKPLAVTGLAVALTDLFCYRVIKFFVQRPRPFLDLNIASWLRHVGDAHGPSFPSNHAANTMAAAVILSAYFKEGRYIFYTFAVLVALSRPALGVHYPTDVIGGALLGFLVARLVLGVLFSRFGAYLKLDKPEKTQRVESEG